MYKPVFLHIYFHIYIYLSIYKDQKSKIKKVHSLSHSIPYKKYLFATEPRQSQENPSIR